MLGDLRANAADRSESASEAEASVAVAEDAVLPRPVTPLPPLPGGERVGVRGLGARGNSRPHEARFRSLPLNLPSPPQGRGVVLAAGATREAVNPGSRASAPI